MIDDPIPGLKEQLNQSILAETARMNQLAAAQMLGVDEARMSNLEKGRLDRFSLQKLIRLLAKMNRRVDLTVVTVGPLPRRRFNEHLLASSGLKGRARDAWVVVYRSLLPKLGSSGNSGEDCRRACCHSFRVWSDQLSGRSGAWAHLFPIFPDEPKTGKRFFKA